MQAELATSALMMAIQRQCPAAGLVHCTRFETCDQARRELFAYIEADYNRQRAHSALGYLTPEQAELKSA